MEKLVFWDSGNPMESVGSMDEIEGFMDCDTAYRVLRGCCYSRVKHQKLSKAISECMDDKLCSLKCPPLEAALKMDEADPFRPLPEDIVSFLEKAYLDGYETIGDRRCAFWLGRLYSQQRYGRIDYPKAAKWFRIGAEAGCGRSEAMLGKCHLLGLGMPKNYEQAFQCLVKWALINEDTEALYLLGDMFWEGLYVQKDTVQAYELYKRAWSVQDDEGTIAGVEALLRVADYELNCIGERKNCHYALDCYQRAESDAYDHLLSNPQEAEQCIAHARDGQTKARRKLKQIIYQQN